MGVEPENTLRSFVRAERCGMDVIALDVRLSKDGALVVLHDGEVDRTTDGAGAVAELTLAELRELDAGHGERVPVLDEVLEAVRTPLQVSVQDEAAATVLTELVVRRDLSARIEVASFQDSVLAGTARRVPGLRTTLYADPHGADVVDRALAAHARTIALRLRRITLETVEAAHTAGLRVTGWTVDSLDQLRLARALELDGALTGLPEIRSTGRFTA